MIKEDPENTFHVLIAEDVKLNFQLVNRVLEKFKPYNFIIYHAKNGKEAVITCQENPNIDLVIMDIRMPIMDGYEATQIIKNLRQDLPVIAYTAFCNRKDIANALNAGCDTVVKKPIDITEFKQTVKKFIDV